MIPHIKNDESLTAVINGEAYSVRSDNPSYDQVWDAIAEEAPLSEIVDLFNAANAVKRYMQGGVEVDGGTILFDGEPIHNLVCDRILEFMSERRPHQPLVKFMERLKANPSRRSIQELYKFLEHKSLPITDDGCFLAYKGVRENYLDCHSGKFSNRPGVTNAMSRQQVDDDFRNGCSYGFHVGSLEYATTFGSRTVIVKVDPADVVSVPDECQCQKLRTSRYTVVCDYQGALPEALAADESPYDAYEDPYDNDAY